MGRIKLGADQIYIGGDALEVLSGLQGKKSVYRREWNL